MGPVEGKLEDPVKVTSREKSLRKIKGVSRTVPDWEGWELETISLEHIIWQFADNLCYKLPPGPRH